MQIPGPLNAFLKIPSSGFPVAQNHPWISRRYRRCLDCENVYERQLLAGSSRIWKAAIGFQAKAGAIYFHPFTPVLGKL